MDPIRPSRALLAVVAALSMALALPLVLPAAPAWAAAPKACKVRNVTRGGSYTSLAAAVKAARSGNRLTVRGTCPGKTRISNKKLTIVGVRTSKSGAPTLRGRGTGPVLTLAGDFAKVTLQKLVIKGIANQALGYDGGGIYNNGGRLTLKHVTIKEFKTKRYGGGIYNVDSDVFLVGYTKIHGNKASNGAGIYNNSGKIVVTDSSAVLLNKGVGISSEGNLAELQLRSKASVRKNTGGGVAAAGKVTMWGQAVISGNSAEEGAGFNGSAALTMNDSSSIKWNSAVYDGGGS